MDDRIPQLYSNIGAAYLGLDYYQSAYQFFSSTLDLLTDSQAHTEYYQIAEINMGAALSKQDMLDAATQVFREVRSRAATDHVRLLYYINMASVMTEKGYHLSFEYYADSVQALIEDFQQYKNNFNSVLVSGYLGAGKPERARKYLMEMNLLEIGEEGTFVNPEFMQYYISYVDQTGEQLLPERIVNATFSRSDFGDISLSARKNLYRLKAKWLAGRSAYQEAYYYQQQADSLYRVQVDSQLHTVIYDYGQQYKNRLLLNKNEELTQDLSDKYQSLKQARRVNALLFIFIALTVVLLIIVLVLYRKRVAINQQLLQLTAREKDLRQREMAQIKEQARMHEKGAQQNATLLLQARQMEESFLQLFDKFEKRFDGELPKEVMRFKHKIKEIAYKYDEFNVEQTLEQNLQSFIERLRLKEPSLTDNELKVCGLIRLGYRNTEIADLLQRTPKSIENFRSRARKKLNVEHDSSLVSFLSSL